MLRKALLSAGTLIGLTGLATAADLPLKAAPPPVYVSTWTGCYVGGHVGYGREESTSSINGYAGVYGYDWYPNTIVQSFNNNGVAGGGQGGCQLQTGNFLWGIEGDWTSFNNSASKSVTNSSFYGTSDPYSNTSTYNETLSKSSLWSIRARFGIITSEVFHLYGTVGFGGEKASAAVSMTYSSSYAGSSYCSTDPSYYCGSGAVSVSKNSTGVVAGVGAEWKIWSNVIVGAEWLHYALANDVTIPGNNQCYYCNGRYGGYTFAQGSSVHFGDADVVRVRASYLFNWWNR
jgi:outer membrane immunogenic protein